MRLVQVLRVVQVRRSRSDIHTDAHSKDVEDRSHPARVSASEVVVDSDEVDAIAGEGVEVQGEARDQRLAFAGLHLGDLALVQDDSSHQLHVEVAQSDAPAARLTAESERVDEQVLELLAVPGALPQLVRAGT